MGFASGIGKTVVYCVMITTGGGCAGVVDISPTTEVVVGAATAPVLVCCADGVFWVSVGVADSTGET